MIRSFANPDGTQKIEDTGPLTKKRMETIDDDIAARSAEFLEKRFTHMHFRTHTKPEVRPDAGSGPTPTQ